jgi:hypothetical protein
VYSREYRDRQREAAARGEQLPVSKSQQKANATKARKEARRAEWAAEALARRSTPLSPAQRAEVQELIREALEEDFVG